MFNQTNLASTALVGIMLVTLYALCTAGREVFVGHVVQQLDPFLLAFSCFSLITIFFVAILIKKDFKQFRLDIKNNSASIWGLNISTAVFWTTSMYALKFIEPSIENSIYTAIGPAITFFYLLSIGRTSYRESKIELLCAMGIFALILLMVAITLFGKTGVGEVEYMSALMGIFLCALAGVGIVANTFFSKNLSMAGMSTNFVLATRFFFLILVTLLLIIFTQSSWVQLVEYHQQIILLAFLGIGLPLFILQKGIERTDPITVSFIVVLGPIFTYGLEIFDNRLTLTMYTLVNINLMVFLVILSIWNRYKKNSIS